MQQYTAIKSRYGGDVSYSRFPLLFYSTRSGIDTQWEFYAEGWYRPLLGSRPKRFGLVIMRFHDTKFQVSFWRFQVMAEAGKITSLFTPGLLITSSEEILYWPYQELANAMIYPIIIRYELNYNFSFLAIIIFTEGLFQCNSN